MARSVKLLVSHTWGPEFGNSEPMCKAGGTHLWPQWRWDRRQGWAMGAHWPTHLSLLGEALDSERSCLKNRGGRCLIMTAEVVFWLLHTYMYTPHTHMHIDPHMHTHIYTPTHTHTHTRSSSHTVLNHSCSTSFLQLVLYSSGSRWGFSLLLHLPFEISNIFPPRARPLRTTQPREKSDAQTDHQKHIREKMNGWVFKSTASEKSAWVTGRGWLLSLDC